MGDKQAMTHLKHLNIREYVIEYYHKEHPHAKGSKADTFLKDVQKGFKHTLLSHLSTTSVKNHEQTAKPRLSQTLEKGVEKQLKCSDDE